MGRNHYFLTSESVTEGHPDKIADQISDAVLDSIYEKDPNGRVACETLVTTGLAFVAGEISTNCYVDIPKIVRETIRDIGYTRAKYGFDYETCAVITAIQEQSPDIALGVDVLGAGDQGLMYGYATKETSELMPLPIMLAHKLVRQLADVRKKGILEYIRPDGKSQVTIEYKDGRPARVDTVVISAQHSPEVNLRQIREDVVEKVILPILPRDLYDPERITFHINPTGRFVVGGPQG
ncbi:MAG TPA: methionine adenosyltransferase, partial [Candidatus Methylomirabilis sp.]